MLPQLIGQRAAKTPHKVAVDSVEQGSLTWAELHENCLIWADAWRRIGVGPGDTVVTMLPNSFEALYSWIGCAWLRGIEVPTNTFYKGQWLSHIIRNSRARTMLLFQRYVEQLVTIAAEIEGLETVVVYDAKRDRLPDLPFRLMTGQEFLEGARPSSLDGPDPWDTSCIVFTSGTTGPSKGVVKPWGPIHAGLGGGLLVPEGLRHDNTHYAPFPPYHMTGKGPIYSAARDDGRVVIRETFSTTEFWNDVKKFGCTGTLIVGAMANFLYRQEPRLDDADNPLRYVVMAPVIPEVDDFKRRFGCEVITGYAMTELNVPLISWEGGREVNGMNYRSCGRVRPGAQVRVVDEHDYPVGPNTVGELIVRDDEPWILNPSYWQMPETTAEAWRNGWFHTGDAFMYDENGDYYFVDRIKDAIRRRGENISSFEVEGAVNSYPEVLESAAVAVPSEWSEDEVKVAVVPKPGRSVDPDKLIQFLIPRMPRFAIPRYIEIVESLPKTPTQRVQKAIIREAGVTERTWDREKAGIALPK